MKKELTRSEIIKLFIDLVEDCRKQELYVRDEMRKQDDITQDILHAIELGNAKDRNKLATQLKYARKDRRYWKDIWTEIEIINEWRVNNPNAANQLKQVLGAMRKEEAYHKERTYKPRELKHV